MTLRLPCTCRALSESTLCRPPPGPHTVVEQGLPGTAHVRLWAPPLGVRTGVRHLGGVLCAQGPRLASHSAPSFSQGTNQQIKAHEASSAVQHVNLLKEWSSSLEKKVRPATPRSRWVFIVSVSSLKEKQPFL